MLLLLPAAFLVLEIPGRPSPLPTLVQELGRVLLERNDGVQGELVIGSDADGTAGDHHGRERFVGFEEVFDGGVGDGEEVRFEVLGVGEEDFGVDDGDEGAGGEVAAGRGDQQRMV